MSKTVMVTGGAGFLGSHLCKRLLSENCRVICIDDFTTGSIYNLDDVRGSKNLEIINHDISSPIYFQVDEIYNLACPASPVHYQRDPIQTTRTCVLGSLNMLSLAQKSGAKILQASTSEVYGDPLLHPQVEHHWGNVNPIGPRSCYDEGKRCAETLFFDYRRKYAINTKIVRIFNTYGPYMHPDDGRVVSNFIVQALKGENITIYGNGLQTRSFCYVDDLIDGLIRMMASSDGFAGPVNLGNPGEFTILELAEKVVSIVGSKSSLIFKPLPQDDPKQRKPNIALAKDKLDWTPSIILEDGLKRTIQYFDGKMLNKS